MKITEYEMKEILQTLSGGYQNFQVNQFTIKAWGEALGEFSLERLQKGLSFCLREHDSGFAPSAGEFRNYCIEAARTPQFRLQQQNERDNLKRLEQQNSEAIPMPENFRKLLANFSGKMNLRDALAKNLEREEIRKNEELAFYGTANA